MDLNINNLCKVLMETGHVDDETADYCIKRSINQQKSIEQILLDERILSREEIFSSLEMKFGIPFYNIRSINPEKSVLDQFDYSVLKAAKAFPIKTLNDKIYIAMAEPLNIFHIDMLKKSTLLDVIPRFSDLKSIIHKQKEFYSGNKIISKYKSNIVRENSIYDYDTIYSDISDDNTDDRNDLFNLISSIIDDASVKNASDIHFDPNEDHILVRFRIDGDIVNMMSLPYEIYPNLISKVKMMSAMNISEKRLPQDGSFEFELENSQIEIRTSIVPTIHGEKIVLRLVDSRRNNIEFDSIGFSSSEKKKIKNIIRSKQGLILVTGPTGSGKTTTLYSILKLLNSQKLNIITIEDPVEYKIEGVNQIEIKPEIGLDFGSMLRSVLRQDPDIIMIGEIRDEETAKLAVSSSITGHMVISTLHTEDSASAVTRLIDMGVEKYLVLSSLKAVVSQRLLRVNCDSCLKEDQLFNSYSEIFRKNEIEKTYKSEGCEACDGSGCAGRTSIFEILKLNDDIREIFERTCSINDIRKELIELDHRTLEDSVFDMLKEKKASIEEYFKIINIKDETIERPTR